MARRRKQAVAATHRLTWGASVEAQREADEAFARLKPKAAKGKPKKRRPKPFVRPDYRVYMKSSKWQRKRRKALKHYGRKCEVCGATDRLNIHHRHYRTLGREAMADLQVLCEGCHANHHEGEVPGVMDPLTQEFHALDL